MYAFASCILHLVQKVHVHVRFLRPCITFTNTGRFPTTALLLWPIHLDLRIPLFLGTHVFNAGACLREDSQSRVCIQ